MSDIEKQLKNVAFGGSWSERILNNAKRDDALSALFLAVEECGERDVRGPDLDKALEYFGQSIGKGGALSSSFRRALSITDPNTRQCQARSVYDKIKTWSGEVIEHSP